MTQRDETVQRDAPFDVKQLDGWGGGGKLDKPAHMRRKSVRKPAMGVLHIYYLTEEHRSCSRHFGPLIGFAFHFIFIKSVAEKRVLH